MNSTLQGKTIIWDGDSICAGNKNKGNWATRICERNAMIYKNYAVGGGTIVEGMPATKNGSPRHCVSLTIEKMFNEFPDADYVIFEGGTNDADLMKRVFDETGDMRIGSYDPEYFGPDFDRNTFCGALESLFSRALKYWFGKKIGFIIAHKMGPTVEEYSRRRKCFDLCCGICKKWGIPYLDLWEGCYLNPFLTYMYDPSFTPAENDLNNFGFYTDGQHLTARGYDHTARIIEKWLLTL